MSPLPCWLAGAQSICLNMSNNDVALQLHFALFKGSRGYVLKPPEMCARAFEDHQVAEEEDSEMMFWPTAREMLHRTTIQLHSLHHLPKVTVTTAHTCTTRCAQSCARRQTAQRCGSHNCAQQARGKFNLLFRMHSAASVAYVLTAPVVSAIATCRSSAVGRTARQTIGIRRCQRFLFRCTQLEVSAHLRGPSPHTASSLHTQLVLM